MAGRATGGRSVDRGDRARGRPRSLHRVVLGAQARPDLVARGAPRGAWADRARAARRDRHVASSRFATWPSVLERSPTAVRHWLHRHGLETGRMSAAPRHRRRSPRRGTDELELPCPRHGMTRHVRRARRLSVRAVSKRARRGLATSRQAAARGGGWRACALCGYDRCDAALQFHHVDPDKKRFAISHEGVTRALSKAREEAAKCVLLCANCHAEVEGGLAQLPLRSADRPVYPA